MKYSILIFLFLTSIIGCASSCSKNEENNLPNNNSQNNDTTTMSSKLKITVNSQTFTATLLDNNSAKAFKEMLPLTINMTELNGNEKYFDLLKSLPTNSSNPGTIQYGDLMLYGSKTLVLFYKSFSTSYSYTKLGRIDNPSDLTTALGLGNVTIKFELNNEKK